MHADPSILNPSAPPPVSNAVASSIHDMKCCPICGGNSGFTYRATIRRIQFMPWKGGKGEAYFEDTGGNHGAYRCDDCRKVIKSNA